MIRKMSEEYRHMGLLFTFNINEKPELCYEPKIVSSLVVLEAMSDILLRLEFRGISLSADSQFKSDYINELLCSLGTVNDDSLAWMSRSVLTTLATGIRSIKFMRDVSSFVLLKQPKIGSTSETNSESSEFSHVSRTHARHWITLLETTTQNMEKLICPTVEKLILHSVNVVMSVLFEKVEEIITCETETRTETSSRVVRAIRQCDVTIRV